VSWARRIAVKMHEIDALVLTTQDRIKERDDAKAQLAALREEGKAREEEARSAHRASVRTRAMVQSLVQPAIQPIVQVALERAFFAIEKALNPLLASAPDTATPNGEGLRKEAEAIMEHAHNPIEYVSGLFKHFEKQLCDCDDRDAAFKNRAHHVNCKGWGPRWAWEKHLPEAVIVERARALGSSLKPPPPPRPPRCLESAPWSG
jgi:hypothetical protein